MSKRDVKPLSEQLKKAIRDSDLSQYGIATKAGVPREVISKFLKGRVGLSLPTIDAIGKVLRLRIVVDDEE